MLPFTTAAVPVAAMICECSGGYAATRVVETVALLLGMVPALPVRRAKRLAGT